MFSNDEVSQGHILAARATTPTTAVSTPARETIDASDVCTVDDTFVDVTVVEDDVVVGTNAQNCGFGLEPDGSRKFE